MIEVCYAVDRFNKKIVVFLKLGLSKKDNSTPVRLVHNTASHLQGPSRCLGGVIVGISGNRPQVK